MKRMIQWMLAATLICGACIFTSCSSDDDNDENATGIALIAKNRNVDYWRQIEYAFRDACKKKGFVAYYYSTSAGSNYQEQVAAVEELKKLNDNTLKGIIYTPCYGPNGENADAEVYALAKQRNIPVIILDSETKATSPLAGYPYIGTDNAAAGRALADKVTADNVAVIAMVNSPGVERAEAFKKVKPNSVIYPVADDATSEVQAIIDQYDDFVFVNGSNLVGVLGKLRTKNKNVYTFDVYDEFLDELIAGSTFFKGIMAQNTFSMANKAVEAVVADAKQGEMVPTFYITKDNLNDANVQPFLNFYNR